MATDRLQGLRTGLGVKAPCVVASTANLVLSGEQTIDGISVGSAQRVLVKDQTDLKENGIYNVGATAWSRAKDFDGDGDAIPGTAVYVDRGPNGGGKFYAVNSSATSTSVVITSYVSSDADDKVFTELSVALAGVSPFSQGTLLPLGTAAAWRSSDGLDIASTISGLQPDVITTQGDIIRGSTTGAASRLAIGASGTVLASTNGLPNWISLPQGSTATAGFLEIATTAETITGTASTLATSPFGVAAVIANLATLETEITTTSGALHDFTGISANAKKITVMLRGISTNGASLPILQLGDSGGIETTGYSGEVDQQGTGGTWSGGIYLRQASAAGVVSTMELVLTLMDTATNTWLVRGVGFRTDSRQYIITAGTKALSATLDRVRLTTANGTDTYDAGAFNILIEE